MKIHNQFRSKTVQVSQQEKFKTWLGRSYILSLQAFFILSLLLYTSCKNDATEFEKEPLWQTNEQKLLMDPVNNIYSVIEEEKYSDMLIVLTFGLIDLAVNPEFRQNITELAQQEFDGDNNGKFSLKYKNY